MWLFSRYGFYSVACASNADGSLDHKTMMVRARQMAHLKNLQKRFPPLANVEIQTSPNRDYRYRLIVSKDVWMNILNQMADEQTWSNFKNEVTRYQGSAGIDYTRALHEVWSVMYKLQAKDSRDTTGRKPR